MKGGSNAGIHVGQSKNIVVRNSRAEFNVAGIEIENSMNADVYGNTATHNAGGILVFDLPNLPLMGGHSHRIYRNDVVDNDTPNFAPKGNIVAGVPTGTGIMVMANRDVHVFENRIDGNATAAVMLVSYTQKFDDKTYNPLPRDIVVRDNKLGKNAWDPKLRAGRWSRRSEGHPPVMWDGVTARRPARRGQGAHLRRAGAEPEPPAPAGEKAGPPSRPPSAAPSGCRARRSCCQPRRTSGHDAQAALFSPPALAPRRGRKPWR